MKDRVLTVNGKEINYGVFSGGEVFLKDYVPEKYSEGNCVLAYVRNSEQLMALMALSYTLKEAWGTLNDVELILSYLPYSRADKISDGPMNQFVGVKMLGDMLDLLGYLRIDTLEVHSPRSLSLVDKLKNHSDDIPWEVYVSQEQYVVVASDKGSVERCAKIADALEVDLIFCEKERDQATGNIIRTVVHDIKKLEGKRGVIFDDICDGGRTFIEISKVIREKYPEQYLHLHVAHGIFSKGLGVLRPHFNKVTWTNEMWYNEDSWESDEEYSKEEWNV